jgi:hypothetical protein
MLASTNWLDIRRASPWPDCYSDMEPLLPTASMKGCAG